MVEDGRLTLVSLSNPTEVKTDRGFGPGDTAAAIKAAYGEDVAASPHEYEAAPAEYLTVWTTGAGDEPYIRSPEARGIRYEIDQSGTVATIHAGGPSIQYVRSEEHTSEPQSLMSISYTVFIFKQKKKHTH